MNPYLLLATLTLVNAGVVPDTECDGVIIGGSYYDKETLKTDLCIPDSIAVDYTTNIMYFSYTSDEIYSKIALIDLNTKEFKDINDIPGVYTQTVDQNTHDVYIVGGNNDIYKYDNKNHKSELYAENNKYIWKVFFKDVLYFSEFPSGVMYSNIDGNITRFKDLNETGIKEFVIDGEHVMFYSKYPGLYAQKKGGKDAVLYSDKVIVRALTVDIHGDAYMCTLNSIYKINKKSMSLEKLLDVEDCFGLGFDSNNNLIYSSKDSLFRLKINKDKKCCCDLSC